MQKVNLKTGSISLKNLLAKPVRTACLFAVITILAFTFFGGTILALNLRQGLVTMTKRFGADLMVIPEGASEKAQALLLRGESGYFYFNTDIVDIVGRTEGVTRASPQLFLTSLSADCCDDAVQLIAYDPATDFVVQPWIAEKKHAAIRDDQVIIGNNVGVRTNGTIKLFNREYPVAAQLSKSASGYDTSIFMTMNTMRGLIENAHELKYNFLADKYEGEVISAILVKADKSSPSSAIAWNIQRQTEGVEVLISQSIFARIAGTISGLVKYIQLFSVALWALAVIVLAAVFSGTIHERKKEFAVLRILGATRRKLVGIVLNESLIAGIAGGFAGIVLACLAVFPFSIYISEQLELPYLESPFLHIILPVLGSLFLSVIAGPLSSLYSALRISKAETYFTMREGE